MSELRYVDLRPFQIYKFEQLKHFGLAVIVVPYLVLVCNYSCAKDDIVIISGITNTEISEFFLPVPESETTPNTGTVTDADTVEVQSPGTESGSYWRNRNGRSHRRDHCWCRPLVQEKRISVRKEKGISHYDVEPFIFGGG